MSKKISKKASAIRTISLAVGSLSLLVLLFLKLQAMRPAQAMLIRLKIK